MIALLRRKVASCVFSCGTSDSPTPMKRLQMGHVTSSSTSADLIQKYKDSRQNVVPQMVCVTVSVLCSISSLEIGHSVSSRGPAPVRSSQSRVAGIVVYWLGGLGLDLLAPSRGRNLLGMILEDDLVFVVRSKVYMLQQTHGGQER